MTPIEQMTPQEIFEAIQGHWTPEDELRFKKLCSDEVMSQVSCLLTKSNIKSNEDVAVLVYEMDCVAKNKGFSGIKQVLELRGVYRNPQPIHPL